MVLDSSAVVAVLLKEPGYERLLRILDKADVLIIGTGTLLEITMVITGRLKLDGRTVIEPFLRRLGVHVVAFTDEHLDAATSAFLRFGRGRHPAGLNFGDCMAYAVAAVAGMPLLFVGDDFAKTDVGRI